MNMPVLPATRPSPTPPEGTARPADAAPADDSPAFSNVLSGQRGAAAPGKHEPAASADRPRTERANRTDKQEPPRPDETLALILDSTTLPLMQALPQTPDAARRAAVPTGRTMPADGLRTGQSAARTAITPELAVEGDQQTDTRRTDTPQAARPSLAAGGQTIVLPGLKPDDAAAPTGRDAPQPGLTPAVRTGTGKPAAPPAANLGIGTDGGSGSGQAPLAAGANAQSQKQTQALPATTTPDALAAAQSAAMQGTLPPAAPTPSVQAPIQIAVPTPLGNPQWPQDFSRQVLGLTQAGGISGHIVQMQVNPPELGPVHITLHLGDSIAQASFVSPHANVRQALENALPHLEQQLAQAGLSLGQANVSDQQPGQQQFSQSPSPGRPQEGAIFSLDGSQDTGTVMPLSPAGGRAAIRSDALVDTFV